MRTPGRYWRGRCGRHPDLDRCQRKGAHEKALIIDRSVTIMGSYNWSKGAASNSEVLNLVTPEVAETYAKHLEARHATSVQFTDRGEWCSP